MFSVKVDTKRIPGKLDEAFSASQYFLDDAALKDSNYYIPANTWNLRDSSLINTRIGSGELVWKTSYARKMYYNPQYNFSEDKNPNARGLWFEEAKAQYLREWLDGSEKAARSKF